MFVQPTADTRPSSAVPFSKASIRMFTDEFKKQFDRLDIVCNNAGVMGYLESGHIMGRSLDVFFWGGANPWVPKGWGGVTHGCPKVGKYIKSEKKVGLGIGRWKMCT